MKTRRFFVRARTLQSFARMFHVRSAFMEKRAAATFLQAWARMNIARAKYVIARKEAKEQAKMENQLAALQRRLDDEAQARARMEAENRDLQERLLSVKGPFLDFVARFSCFLCSKEKKKSW